MPALLRETYPGITRVEILNRRENVRFSSPRSAKSSAVGVNGTLMHPALGASRSADTLYLIAYEGELTLPDSVAIHYKRGIDDLQRELVDTYAPSLSYGSLLESRKMARALGAYVDVPIPDAMEVMRRFANSTTRSFFAPQSEVGAPPALERLERKIRSESFRWNGSYPFLAKVAADGLVVIPELQGARTSAELWDRMLGFIANRVYAKGPALAALVQELNKLMLLDAKSLGDFILDVQPAMVSAEPQGEALATTARQQAETALYEGLEILKKKKIPYASTLMKLYGGVAAPISHEAWEWVMAETGAHEASLLAKRGPKAEGSKKVVEGEVGIRLADNLETAFNGKKMFSMCLHGEAVAQLRLLAGASDNFAVETYVKTETKNKVKEWVASAQSYKTTMTGFFGITSQRLRERVEFTPDQKRNRVTVRFTGESCDQEFEKSARPTPAPSPSPTAPPTTSNGGSNKGFLSDMWDWCASWF